MNEEKPYNEPELLRLLAEGSQYAFTQLFSRYHDKVYVLAARLCKSKEWAQEITQDTFLKIWQKHEGISNVQNFEAYLMTIARNLIWDELQNHAKIVVAQKEFASDQFAKPSTGASGDEDVYHTLLWQAINEMPPQRQQVFRMGKIEGLSYEQIASRLNLSHATVKNHMLLALEFIRTRLNSRKAQLGSAMLIALLLEIF